MKMVQFWFDFMQMGTWKKKITRMGK